MITYVELSDESSGCDGSRDIQLCRLLEAEFRHIVVAKKTSTAHCTLLKDILQLRLTTAESVRALYRRDQQFGFVDFDTFREGYWAHFPGSLKDGLSALRVTFTSSTELIILLLGPELVFGEILGMPVESLSERKSSTMLSSPAGIQA